MSANSFSHWPSGAQQVWLPRIQVHACARFPKPFELKETTARGRLLHYFANHELLAIETMAYVLLRFPDADSALRSGVFRTLQDELGGAQPRERNQS